MIYIIADTKEFGEAIKRSFINPNNPSKVLTTENSLRGLSIKPTDEVLIWMVKPSKLAKMMPTLSACLISSLST